LLLLHATTGWSNTVAQFRTYFGDMDVELYDQHKPITVGNFIRYVQQGLYQNSFVHRCDPGFVIQGGGYFFGFNTNGAFLDRIPRFPPIPNEFGAGARYSNVYGTIAMAMAPGDTNSATSEWFINLADNTFLDAPTIDGHFTVFGRVLRGTNVLETFKTFRRNRPINVITNWSIFSELPLLTPNLTIGDFLFVDITLLNVHVQRLANGSREISWNSVAGKPNYVEFTTNMPPSWHTLLVTNAVTNTVTVTDPSAGAGRRFYRVRVDY
jgi:cyclophilin family peptidyl-prolyl cis-trans isomerase